MVEHPTRGFRGSKSRRSARSGGDEGQGWRRVLLDDLDGQLERVDHLDEAHEDALERIPTRHGEADAVRQTLDRGRKPIEVQVETGEWAAEVSSSTDDPGVQRVRVGHVLLGEVGVVVRDADVEPSRRHDPPFIERVFTFMAKGDELVVAFELGYGEGSDPLEAFGTRLPGPAELGQEWLELRLGRGPIKAAHAHVDRMNLAPPEAFDDRIAGFLDPQ